MQRNWKKILIGIVFLGIISILYINNVITSNRIVKDNLKLKENLQKVKEQNLMLKKKIIELESPERIIEIATQKYGMKFPEKPAKKL